SAPATQMPPTARISSLTALGVDRDRKASETASPVSARAKGKADPRREAPSTWLPWLLTPIVLVVGFGLGRLMPRLSPAVTSDQHDSEQAEVWTCSMHPQIRQ